MNTPNCKHPCKNCPFRKDTLKGWLGAERMREILKAKSFVCHKNHSLQCAGHLIIKKEENTFFQFAQSLDIDLGLKGQDLIFSNEEDCINHHK